MAIADDLREYADYLKGREVSDDDHLVLMGIADQIDREHGERLWQCRRETKRAFARYMRSVITDYEKGVKRVRKDKRC